MSFNRIFISLFFILLAASAIYGQSADTTIIPSQKQKKDSVLIVAQLNSLEAVKKTGNKKNISRAYYNTGLFYSEHKDYTAATEYYMLSLIVCRETSDDEGMANCFQSLADAHRNLNHYAEAVRYYSDAIGAYNALGYKTEMAYCYLAISEVYEVKKNIPQAIKYTRQAKNIYAFTKDSEKQNNCTIRIKYLKAK